MQLKITLKELIVFFVVVKKNKIHMAANELGMTQSAVSQSLAKLEQTLNVSLFDRHGRHLILNENGRLLIPQVTKLLDQATEIEHFFNQEQISLKLGASTTIGNYLMPAYLAKIKAVNHDAKLDMMVNNTDAIIQAVANFDVDIGLIEGECRHNNIHVFEWQDDEMVVFGAFNHEMNTKLISHSQLSNMLWLLREKGSGTRDKVENFLTQHLGRFNLDMELGNSEAIKYAVAAGLGISCLSKYVVNDLLEQQKITLLNTKLPPLNRKLYCLINKNKFITKGMRLFLETLNISTHKVS